MFDESIMISKALLKELDQIVREEYNMNLTEAQVARFGEFLVSYFQTLIDIEKDHQQKMAGGKRDVDTKEIRGMIHNKVSDLKN